MISIILPCYNRSYNLELCLKSFVNQTTQDFEVIVVDDDSPDDTSEQVCKKFNDSLNITYKKFEYPKDKVHLFRLSKSRHEGAKLANGELLFFCDQDIILEPETLKKHLDIQNQYINTIGHSEVHMLDKTSDELIDEKINDMNYLKSLPTTKAIRQGVYDSLSQIRLYTDRYYGYSMFSSSSIVKNFYFHCGGFHPDWVGYGHEDMEFSYRILRTGGKFLYCRDIQSFHIKHPPFYSHHKTMEVENKKLIARNSEIIRKTTPKDILKTV